MAAPSMPAHFGDVPPQVELPAKVFTVEEADRLLPSLESIFREMAQRSLRLREVLELAQDLEEYWGDRIGAPEFPERAAYLELVREREELQASLQQDIERILGLGAVLKDYQQGLVDFYGIVEGRLVFLCWQRGETALRFYHTLESGFAGRRPLATAPQP